MVLTYSPGQVSDTVDVLHLGPDAQRLTWSVDGHVGIYSQLALWGGGSKMMHIDRERSLGLEVQQLRKQREAGTDTETESDFHTIPDMLPWQVPRACRMSWSSLTAAAASSPQLMSGSITSSIRPTPDGWEDSCVLHLYSIYPMELSDKPQHFSLCQGI